MAARSRHSARPYWWLGKQDYLAEAPVEDQVGWPPQEPTEEELYLNGLADARWHRAHGYRPNRVF